MSDEELPIKRGRGRPKGSRNRASIDKAQDVFDAGAERYANIVMALAENDKAILNTDADVPATVRLAACKLGLGKALADEKEKDAVVKAVKNSPAEVVDEGPKIYMTATNSEL